MKTALFAAFRSIRLEQSRPLLPSCQGTARMIMSLKLPANRCLT